jgi:hypothetical protein
MINRGESGFVCTLKSSLTFQSAFFMSEHRADHIYHIDVIDVVNNIGGTWVGFMKALYSV